VTASAIFFFDTRYTKFHLLLDACLLSSSSLLFFALASLQFTMIIGVNNHKRTPVSTMLKLKHRRCSWAFAAIILCLFGGRKNADAFVTRLPSSTFTRSIHQTRLLLTPIIDPVSSSSSTDVLLDYAPAAAALFNNMKTPASILSAGMVSLGFLAPFRLSDSMKRSPKLLRRVELLKRAYILVTLVSFCSELLAVMWATVAVNQLTETVVLPATSVWTLLQRDFDLSWSATNSHFVLGKWLVFCYTKSIQTYHTIILILLLILNYCITSSPTP
jgi:hypothetical protein